MPSEARCVLWRTAAVCDKLRKGTLLNFTPNVTFMKLEIPPNYKGVEFPERRKLKFFDRVPSLPTNQRPPKMMRQPVLMRGPELIHNRIQFGEFGIVALTGGLLRYGHLEMMRLTINRKMDDSRMFAVWRIDQPWKAVTRKGQGHRMGGGKGAIDHYVFPLKADRVIVEMGGTCEFKEVEPILEHIRKCLPFPAKVVSKQSMLEEEEEKRCVEENNLNPFTFKYCVQNNMMGCKIHLSRYDLQWFNKYR